MMNWIFENVVGRTGRAFFDVSSVVHFAFWVFFGSTFWYFKCNRWLAMGICLVIALGWEVAEGFLAKAYPNVWQHPESWWNAWLSDPLMCVLGCLLIWFLMDHWTV